MFLDHIYYDVLGWVGVTIMKGIFIVLLIKFIAAIKSAGALYYLSWRFEKFTK